MVVALNGKRATMKGEREEGVGFSPPVLTSPSLYFPFINCLRVKLGRQGANTEPANKLTHSIPLFPRGWFPLLCVGSQLHLPLNPLNFT